jgi:hypothetical protein
MDVVYIYKRRYEIQGQNEVPVWYTCIYRPISSTGNKKKSLDCLLQVISPTREYCTKALNCPVHMGPIQIPL